MKTWNEMNVAERLESLRLMHLYGGNFASALSHAWKAASPENAEKLAREFDPLLKRYAPGSPCYMANAHPHAIAAARPAQPTQPAKETIAC